MYIQYLSRIIDPPTQTESWIHEFEGNFYREGGGDRGIIHADGRLSLQGTKEVAIRENGSNRPKFDAFILLAGGSLLSARKCSNVFKL